MRRLQHVCFFVLLLWWTFVLWYTAATAWYILDGCARALNAASAVLALGLVAAARFYGYRPMEWRSHGRIVNTISILLGVVILWALLLSGMVEVHRYGWESRLSVVDDFRLLYARFGRFMTYRLGLSLIHI